MSRRETSTTVPGAERAPLVAGDNKSNAMHETLSGANDNAQTKVSDATLATEQTPAAPPASDAPAATSDATPAAAGDANPAPSLLDTPTAKSGDTMSNLISSLRQQ